MAVTQLLDVPMGLVPDYRSFVRHVWGYVYEGKGVISPPPFVFRLEFDGPFLDWFTALDLAEQLIEEHDLDDRLETGIVAGEDATGAHEVRFCDLEVLHQFCVRIGTRSRHEKDESAVRVGEFLMWSLGFRWV